MSLKIVFVVVVVVSSAFAGELIDRAVDSKNGCMRSEVWKDCGTPCEEVCGKAKDPNCGTQCVPACQCPDGHARATADPRASCIPREQCGKCGAHERVVCEMSCDNINEHPHICPMDDCGPRAPCFCSDGYVRDRTTGECVLQQNCPAKRA